ncbi:YczE/YyaS/YitT family protein [Amnibacterium kyonggiense]|uniref:Putative membrane protein YczE n=1 Tax=Amnibacterium kyonggiense TaxID=595671 RepID=A0A4R7FLW4_9MICO|nr:hypothetical protein [Amnibacterium kyonggiense]TDS77369.1 putative membrane protein YczE [Amnibacterium kyonggiense]
MVLDPTLAVTAAVGAVVLLAGAVRREAVRDGFGLRPGPRSHDAAVPAARPLALPQPAALLRGGQLVVGLLLYGASLALMLRAQLGVGPWDVLAQGVARVTGVPFGLVTNGIGALLLLLWVPLRQRPGIGTLLNVLLVGTAAQVVLDLIAVPEGLLPRIALLVGGMLLLAVATAVYVGAGLGAGPRDGLMLGLHRRFGWPVWLARAVVEGSALLLGWLLGGNVGIGTIAFALGIGPLCGVAIRLLAPSQLRRH